MRCYTHAFVLALLVSGCSVYDVPSKGASGGVADEAGASRGPSFGEGAGGGGGLANGEAFDDSVDAPNASPDNGRGNGDGPAVDAGEPQLTLEDGGRDDDDGFGTDNIEQDAGPTDVVSVIDSQGADATTNDSAADATTNDSTADVVSPLMCSGHGIQFGGFAYVRVNRPVQDDFTLEAWMKATVPTPNGNQFWEGSGLIYADTFGNNNDFGSSVLNDHLAFGVGNPGSNQTTLVGTTKIVDGTWHHVAMTRRESTTEIKIYVDGALEGATLVPGQTNPLSAQSNMAIGANAINGRYFVGVLDEVRAWNVVRSQEDISSTMHKRLNGDEAGIVGYWRFDEGSGMSAGDSSHSGNVGDIIGPVNWVASDAPICP